MREVTITEPGYAYIFFSNENLTQVDVHFDDVKITHTHSNIVAGADYYPFGLAMDGREIDDEPYRYGYQGQFSEKDLTTGMQEFELRMYDPRIGRWLSPDPYGQFHSPYLAMGNVPHMSVDGNGGWSWVTAGIGAAVGAGIGYAATGDWKGALIGGLAGGAIGGLSFDQTRVGFDGGTSLAHSNLRIKPSSFGRVLASNSLAVLDDVGGFYIQVESIDPHKWWFENPIGGNAGSFDQDDIRPDEALMLYLDLGGYRHKYIKSKTDCWFCVPDIDVDFGDNWVDGRMEYTEFLIKVKVEKNGILIHCKTANSREAITLRSIFRRTVYDTQAVRITASLDPNFNPKRDPIIGALSAGKSSVIQKSFLPNGHWGPLPRGRLPIK